MDCDPGTMPICPSSKPIMDWCHCRCESGSPILVDVAGDGFSLTDGASGVGFDLDGDGSLDRVSYDGGGR